MPSLAARPDETPWRVAIVGAGAVGTVIALRLHQMGVPIATIISRTGAHARALAARVGARSGTEPHAILLESVNTVICCTPDRAVETVDHALAAARPRWTGSLVIHTSGALSSHNLSACAAAGAAVASFHPIQTFTATSSSDAFAGIYVGIEGPADALDACRAMAHRLGAHPVVVPANQKATYHLACALASNYLTTLLHLAAEALSPLGIDEATALRILAPLTDRALANARATTPALALTGPLVRGDIDTLASHLSALHTPEQLALYLALADETLRMAREAGRLDAGQTEALRHFLDDCRRDTFRG